MNETRWRGERRGEEGKKKEKRGKRKERGKGYDHIVVDIA